MTDLDKPEFAQAMNRLCVALREKDPDVVQMRVYFEALKDLDIELVTAASERLAQSAAWFPKTSEWRDAVVAVERERVIAQQALLRKLVAPLCRACRDTGWEPVGTDPDAVRRCDCQHQRRLEILGRSPWPELPEHAEKPDPGQFEQVRKMIQPLLEKS